VPGRARSHLRSSAPSAVHSLLGARAAARARSKFNGSRFNGSTVQGSGVQRHPVFPSSLFKGCERVQLCCLCYLLLVQLNHRFQLFEHQKVKAWWLTRGAINGGGNGRGDGDLVSQAKAWLQKAFALGDEIEMKRAALGDPDLQPIQREIEDM